MGSIAKDKSSMTPRSAGKPREQYETSRDRKAERALAQQLMDWLTLELGTPLFRCVKITQPRLTVCPDFRIVHIETEQVAGYIEVKNRSNFEFAQMIKWGGPMLSTKKYIMLRSLVDKGYWTIFLCALEDRVGYYNIATAKTKHVPNGGRKTIPPHFALEDVEYFPDPIDFVVIGRNHLAL